MILEGLSSSMSIEIENDDQYCGVKWLLKETLILRLHRFFHLILEKYHLSPSNQCYEDIYHMLPVWKYIICWRNLAFFWPNSFPAVTSRNDLRHVSFPFFSWPNEKAQHSLRNITVDNMASTRRKPARQPRWGSMRPAHPQHGGKVTKLPAISYLLPPMEKLSKNPVLYVCSFVE